MFALAMLAQYVDGFKWSTSTFIRAVMISLRPHTVHRLQVLCSRNFRFECFCAKFAFEPFMSHWVTFCYVAVASSFGSKRGIAYRARLLVNVNSRRFDTPLIANSIPLRFILCTVCPYTYVGWQASQNLYAPIGKCFPQPLSLRCSPSTISE